MSIRIRALFVVVLAALVALTGATAAHAGKKDIRELQGAKKAAFMKDVGWTDSPDCYNVGVARSNSKWAIAAPSGKCGPNSGHNAVYSKNKRGTWVYRFYDMQNDGCKVFKMPKSVRKDFRPFVC